MELITFEELARLPIFYKFYSVAQKLFGVHIALMRPGNRQGITLGPPQDANPFCRLVQRDPAGRRMCVECDYQNQQRVLATGQSLLYTCHAGLTDFIIPIFIQQRIIAFLQCGQVLDKRPTPAAWQRTRTRLKGMRINYRQLKKHFFRTPVIRPRDQRNLVELLEIFANYIADTGRRLLLMAQGRKSQIVSLTELFVREHLAESVALDQVARAAYTSKRNLTRVFWAETGMTVLAFIHQTRIAAACELLQRTDKKILDIAFECGFGSIQQFNRVFKKVMKTTPDALRRSVLPAVR